MTAVSPFWADELFADIDHAIFRTDPWRLFSGIDLTFHAWAYSFFWAVAIMATMVWLLARKPSVERSTSLLSYFALWSIFGPIGQYFLSSAGPIFYRRLGFGDRFAELSSNIPEATQIVSGYLWNFHTTGTLGVGAGISAMPSLHIATVAWIYLAFRGQRSKHRAVRGDLSRSTSGRCRWRSAGITPSTGLSGRRARWSVSGRAAPICVGVPRWTYTSAQAATAQ